MTTMRRVTDAETRGMSYTGQIIEYLAGNDADLKLRLLRLDHDVTNLITAAGFVVTNGMMTAFFKRLEKDNRLYRSPLKGTN